MKTIVNLSYDDNQKLGKGSFGTVFAGSLTLLSSKSTPVAIKQIQRGRIERNFQREVEIMKKAGDDPYILRILHTETTDDFL